MRQIRYFLACMAVMLAFLPSCQDQVINERTPQAITSADSNTNSSALYISDQACQTFRDCKDGALCMSASVNDADGMYCGYVYKADAQAKAGLALNSACNCIWGHCTVCEAKTGSPAPQPASGSSGSGPCVCIKGPCNCVKH